MTTVGIVGVGAVGKMMAVDFPGAQQYDEPRQLGTRAAVNSCEVVFVCVPTLQGDRGQCDTSIVEEVVRWLEAEIIVIRSTVAVGTCRRMAEETGKRVVFQPEYAMPDHPEYNRNVNWAVLGGPAADTSAVANLWQTVRMSDFEIRQTTWEAAELSKYMTNTFLATKVTFCNEFFDIAQKTGVDYHELRDLWLMDPRIGDSHTWVFPENRGFGGKCFPKDLAAMIQTAVDRGSRTTLLDAVAEANRRFRE